MSKFLDGFKFGIMLQVAVGPVCFFVFQISVLNGIIPALLGTLGVTLIDGFYILLAILGIGKIIEKHKNAEKILKYFGSLVLITFGLYIFLSTLNNSSFVSHNTTPILKFNPFISTCLLTISNPLTIIFWTGVFATKTTRENMNFKELTLFGIGSVISTFVFLSLISIAGDFTKTFISNSLIMLLNILIGLLLIFFGIKPYIKLKRLKV